MFLLSLAYIVLAGRGSAAGGGRRARGEGVAVDLMRARVALRERPLLDVLDLAIRFCTSHAGAYARLSLAVVLPAFALTCAAGVLVGPWLAWIATVLLTALTLARAVHGARAMRRSWSSPTRYARAKRCGWACAGAAGALHRCAGLVQLAALAWPAC